MRKNAWAGGLLALFLLTAAGIVALRVFAAPERPAPAEPGESMTLNSTETDTATTPGGAETGGEALPTAEPLTVTPDPDYVPVSTTPGPPAFPSHEESEVPELSFGEDEVVVLEESQAVGGS